MVRRRGGEQERFINDSANNGGGDADEFDVTEQGEEEEEDDDLSVGDDDETSNAFEKEDEWGAGDFAERRGSGLQPGEFDMFSPEHSQSPKPAVAPPSQQGSRFSVGAGADDEDHTDHTQSKQESFRDDDHQPVEQPLDENQQENKGRAAWLRERKRTKLILIAIACGLLLLAALLGLLLGLLLNRDDDDGAIHAPVITLAPADSAAAAATPAQPTAAPTAAPIVTTTGVVDAPGAAPIATQPPSKAPTRAPTGLPTVAPTRAPSKAPTRAPTTAPTQAPIVGTAPPQTAAPTVAPVTVAPTTAPTTTPTIAPVTGVPTKAPTVAPVSTAAPTTSPVTAAPTTATEFITDQALFDLVVQNTPATTQANILNTGTSQRAAYLWLQQDTYDVTAETGPPDNIGGPLPPVEGDDRRRRRQRKLQDLTNPFVQFSKVQRFRLACFYFGTLGPTMWLDTTRWLSQTSECTWNGVTCNMGRAVKELTFWNNQVSGRLVPEMRGLSELSVLVIDNTGSNLPGFDGAGGLYSAQLRQAWPKMERLIISGHDFSNGGRLPDNFFGGWSQATQIDLSNNGLTGPIPFSIGNLMTVTELNLSGNQFTSVPDVIAVMSNVLTLDLSNNNLSGPLSDDLLGLSKVKTLKLNGNQFSGPLPHLSNKMQGLGGAAAPVEHLDLSDNSFSGPMEAGSFDLLTNVQTLNLARNADLSGPLPNMAGLTSIRNFDWTGLPLVTGTVPLDPVCNSVNAFAGQGQIDCVVPCDEQQNICCACCCLLL